MGERSVLQVDAVIESVEVVFLNFILAAGFFNRKRGGRGKFIIIGTHQNFFVETSEHMALAKSERLRYIDDNCIIWKHITNKLHVFMDHMNNLQSTIYQLHQIIGI